MMPTMTKEIQVGDYPEINPDTEEGREDFGCLAVHLSRESNGMLTHFIFKRGDEKLGEMYVTDMLTIPC